MITLVSPATWLRQEPCMDLISVIVDGKRFGRPFDNIPDAQDLLVSVNKFFEKLQEAQKVLDDYESRQSKLERAER